MTYHLSFVTKRGSSFGIKSSLGIESSLVLRGRVSIGLFLLGGLCISF